jgi:hypothetical protein
VSQRFPRARDTRSTGDGRQRNPRLVGGVRFCMSGYWRHADCSICNYVVGGVVGLLSIPVYLVRHNWSTLKLRLPKQSLSSLDRVATGARWWFGLLGLTLLAVVVTPAIHEYPKSLQPPTTNTSPPEQKPASLKPPQTDQSPEQTESKIGIWDSVINSNLRILVEDFNALDLVLSRWPRLVTDANGRRQLYQDITNAAAAYLGASRDLEILRSEYPNYQDVADALAQPNRSELERVAANFADAIAKLPQEPPANFEVSLRPLAGAVRSQMNVTQDWLTNLSRTANRNLEQLRR